MKKILAAMVSALTIPFALASSSRGAAAYLVLTQKCQGATGTLACTPVDNSGISVIVVLILAAIGIYIWQNKHK